MSDFAHIEEERLVERALARDDEAFAELVRRYERSLFNIVFGVVGDAELARDVAQETFLRAYQFLDRYRKSFRFSTWLFRIGVNLGISRMRRVKLESDTFSQEGVQRHGLLRAAGSESPVEGMMREERARAIMNGFRELSERYRSVLLMRYRDGMSCRDIGLELGISANTVSIILHRGKLKLREFLVGEEEA
ncbi:MAG: sigma-70 family RNA polymerase sigma factor [Planctomycetes bacterium]|nr:sigma-70 family RNA polymerase sigma factor [Planctomycetota bacterium]